MPVQDNDRDQGLVQIFTGNGKGKTSAALGAAMRAVGAGLRPAIIFFDKGGDRYSERRSLLESGLDIPFWVTGLDRIDRTTGRFRFGVTEGDLKEAGRGLALARKLLDDQRIDLAIFDELITSINLGMIEESDVLELLRRKPPQKEVIMTGRGCSDKLKEAADLVTEMNLVKHYFYHGIPAREGFDY